MSYFNLKKFEIDMKTWHHFSQKVHHNPIFEYHIIDLIND
jgi:hypothetical protein